MEYAGAARELMRLLSVTDVKCKKAEKMSGMGSAPGGFFFYFFFFLLFFNIHSPTTHRNKVIQMV